MYLKLILRTTYGSR